MNIVDICKRENKHRADWRRCYHSSEKLGKLLRDDLGVLSSSEGGILETMFGRRGNKSIDCGEKEGELSTLFFLQE